MRILQSFAIAVLLAVLGPSAAAQEQPPAPAEPKPFELPQATRFTLANGMGVTLVPYGSLPQLVAQVTLRVGNLNEGERTWLADLDAVIAELQTELVPPDELARARVKLRADLFNTIGGFYGFGRADLLASFALFDDDPARINALEAEFDKVTPELIRATAQEYLRATNRTIQTLVPQSGEE